MPVLISKLLEGRVRGNNDWIPNASWKESFRIEKALMNPSQCVYECTNTKVVSSWLPMVYLLLFGLVWYRHHPIMCCWSTEKCGRYHQIPKMPLSWKGNFTLQSLHCKVRQWTLFTHSAGDVVTITLTTFTFHFLCIQFKLGWSSGPRSVFSISLDGIQMHGIWIGRQAPLHCGQW